VSGFAVSKLCKAFKSIPEGVLCLEFKWRCSDLPDILCSHFLGSVATNVSCVSEFFYLLCDV